MSKHWLRFGEREVELPAGPFVVGRGDECDLVIDDVRVSRRHAIFEVAAEVSVRDLESRNGVLVNGRKITARKVLRDGDRISVGVREMMLEDANGRAQRRRLSTLPPEAAPADQVRVRAPRDRPTTKLALDLLSDREREVLRLLARGYKQREVAEELGVSTKTVETYRARISEKLDLNTRQELVAFALLCGLLEPDPAGEAGERG